MGINRFGAVGTGGTGSDVLVPVRVQGIGDVIAAAAGDPDFSVALRADGSVWSWGYDGNGQQGNGYGGSRTLPGRVAAVGAAKPAEGVLVGGTALAANGVATGFVVRQGATVAAWGRTIGDGDGNQRPTPVLVGGSEPLVVRGVFPSAGGAWATIGDGRVVWWGGQSGPESCEKPADPNGSRPALIASAGTGGRRAGRRLRVDRVPQGRR